MLKGWLSRVCHLNSVADSWLETQRSPRATFAWHRRQEFCVQEGTDELTVLTMPLVLGRIRAEGVAELGCQSVPGLLHLG